MSVYRTLMRADNRFPLRRLTAWPLMGDRHKAPSLHPHYFYHPAWAARVLQSTAPKKHVDISSILHFAGQVSAFIPTDYYELNPLQVELDNLTVRPGSLCQLPLANDSVPSLSCMHVLEHVGLGRYGDPIDATGDLKAAAELCRVLAPAGTLLIVVPIDVEPRIEFNAQRVYTYALVLKMFESLELAEFALIGGQYGQFPLKRNASERDIGKTPDACGCFHFRKRT